MKTQVKLHDSAGAILALVEVPHPLPHVITYGVKAFIANRRGFPLCYYETTVAWQPPHADRSQPAGREVTAATAP